MINFLIEQKPKEKFYKVLKILYHVLKKIFIYKNAPDQNRVQNYYFFLKYVW